jgi:hypothetical protein
LCDEHLLRRLEHLRTFLGHGDVRLLLLLAKAVVMSIREVSAIPGLGGRSLGQVGLTNQVSIKTATSPLPHPLSTLIRPHASSVLWSGMLGWFTLIPLTHVTRIYGKASVAEETSHSTR